MHPLPYHHDWRLAYQTAVGLRVHWFGRYAGKPDWQVETSRLASDMVSFVFIERNKCWAVVNGRRMNLKRGDLLVVMGGDEFSFGHEPSKPHTSLSVSLALDQGGMANALLYRKFERRYSWRKPEEYIAEFEKVMATLAGTSPGRDLKIAGAIILWLDYLLARLNPPMDRAFVEGRSTVDKVLLAESWANAHLQTPITLAEWARAAGLNPVYFGRVFKRETGLRPMDWLNHRRLQMACQHLASTSKSVGEISEACGFASPFYFSRVFRRHSGVSPVKYRSRVTSSKNV